MIKKYELEPTFENVAETLLNDTLKRNNYLYKFYDLLKCINSSCSICLDGAWGSGKTFFVKQAQLLLLSENPLLEIGKLDIDITEEEKNKLKEIQEAKLKKIKDIKNIQYPIYYDAWDNDKVLD